MLNVILKKQVSLQIEETNYENPFRNDDNTSPNTRDEAQHNPELKEQIQLLDQYYARVNKEKLFFEKVLVGVLKKKFWQIKSMKAQRNHFLNQMNVRNVQEFKDDIRKLEISNRQKEKQIEELFVQNMQLDKSLQKIKKKLKKLILEESNNNQAEGQRFNPQFNVEEEPFPSQQIMDDD